MKSGEGARKHEQAVPCRREAGTAPGGCREVAEPQTPSPPSPQGSPQPGCPSRKEPGACWPQREKLRGSWWMLH